MPYAARYGSGCGCGLAVEVEQREHKMRMVMIVVDDAIFDDSNGISDPALYLV